MRILNVTAVAVCLVLMLSTAALSELFGGTVHFTGGESVEADGVLAMKTDKLKARFVTYDGGTVQFDNIASIEFPGETDFRDGFKFVVTGRDGERISGWIRKGTDFGYMWEVTSGETEKAYKLNQGVRAERKMEVERIVFEPAD